MSFQHIIVGKVKLNGLGGMCHHLLDRDRVKTNPNINLSRSHLNYSIEALSPENFSQRVNSRIKQLNLKKRPRSDAVGIVDFVVSASPDFIIAMDSELRERYFLDSLHFIQCRYGKENVMYCQCHMDEATPHIHVGIVPVTLDGRLSAKALFTPKSLEHLQSDFHISVSKSYGLERGEHHSNRYLPLQQFKSEPPTIKIAGFSGLVSHCPLHYRAIPVVPTVKCTRTLVLLLLRCYTSRSWHTNLILAKKTVSHFVFYLGKLPLSSVFL